MAWNQECQFQTWVLPLCGRKPGQVDGILFRSGEGVSLRARAPSGMQGQDVQVPLALSEQPRPKAREASVVVPVKVKERERIRRSMRAQKHTAAGSVGLGWGTVQSPEPQGGRPASPEQKRG